MKKQKPAPSFDEIISGISTWHTDEFEISFLSSICFLIEGQPEKGETELLLEVLTVVDETWFTEVHRKAVFYVVKKLYLDSSNRFVVPGSIGMMAKEVLKLRGYSDQLTLVDDVTTAPSFLYTMESFSSILPFWRVKLARNKMRNVTEQLLDIFNEAPDKDALFLRVPELMEQQQDIWHGFSLVNSKADDWGSSVDELLSPLPGDISVSTGLTVLDDAIQGGIARRNSPYSGRLIVVAARPSMGKSTIAIYLATQLAAFHGDVAFFSLEMSKRQVQYKAIACHDYMMLKRDGNLTNPVRAHNLQSRSYTKEQRERLQEYKSSPLARRFHVYDSTENINTLSSKVSLLAKTRPALTAIFVDYLQLIEGCSGDASNTEASNIGNVTRALKQLAVKTGIDIFLLSQVNRGVESRNDKMPTLADLRASGRIEEDADIVMFLLRPSYYDQQKDPYELAIGVAKNRHGICGTLQCNIDLQSSVIFDRSVLGGQ